MPAEAVPSIRLNAEAEIFYPGDKISDLVGYPDRLGVFSFCLTLIASSASLPYIGISSYSLEPDLLLRLLGGMSGCAP